MASLRVKPGQRLTVSDWHTNNHLISSNAERQRWGSHCTRQEARGLRSETSNKTKWDEQDTCTRLSDRIDEVTKWKDSLLKCLEDVDTEIKALTTVKESTEKALAATSLPLDVAIECLTLREGRRGNDLVRDPVEAELHKEVEVIDRARKVLQQKASQAFEQLCLLQEVRQQLTFDLRHKGDVNLLQEVRQQLTFDLRHKNEALDVDRSCLSLNVNSAGLSLKLSPSRVPPGSTDPQQWEKFSHYNCNRAQEEMRASTQLQEAMRMKEEIQEMENDLRGLEDDLQAKMAPLKLAHTRLETRTYRPGADLCRDQMKEEIQEMENDLRGLEDDLQAKMAPLKLAHTRLETRTYRPGADLCRDQVQHGLTDEVQQLEGTMTALKQKRAQSHMMESSIHPVKTFYRMIQTIHHLDNVNEAIINNRMKEEIQEMENDLRGLEDDLQAKMAPLKLAHTRLETRTYRPGADLCRDQTRVFIKSLFSLDYRLSVIPALHHRYTCALTNHFATVSLCQSAVRLVQCCSGINVRFLSRDVLHALSQQLTRIEEDIACKTSSLSLERRSLDTRSKLIVPPEKHVPETDTFNRTLSPVKSRQLELA
ncbi:UNVERIFIED_CONTAM: hypothetical protein FKN15_049198 [Acipenser sinensis]